MRRSAVVSSVLIPLFGAAMIFAQNDGVVKEEAVSKKPPEQPKEFTEMLKDVKESNTDKKLSTEADWIAFGKSLKEKAPVGLNEMQRVKWIVSQVSKELSKTVRPNSSIPGRLYAAVVNGDKSAGSCVNASDTLAAALNGAGISREGVVAFKFSTGNNNTLDEKLVAEKEGEELAFNLAVGSGGWGVEAAKYLDVNSNHGAVVVMIDGKPYVFDMWSYAVGTGTYDNMPTDNIWNGMPLSEWEKRMKESGYKLFTSADRDLDPKSLQPTNFYQSVAVAMKGYVNQQKGVENLKEMNELIAEKKKTLSPQEALDEATRQTVAEFKEIAPKWAVFTDAEAMRIYKVYVRTVYVACADFDGTNRYRIATIRYSRDEKGKEYVGSRSDALYTIGEVRSLLSDKKRELKAAEKKH